MELTRITNVHVTIAQHVVMPVRGWDAQPWDTRTSLSDNDFGSVNFAILTPNRDPRARIGIAGIGNLGNN